MAGRILAVQTNGPSILPDLSDPKVCQLFGMNVAGVLKGGDLLTPMDRDLVSRLTEALGAPDRLFVYKICAATTPLSHAIVQTIARVLRRHVMWFFSRHADEEFASAMENEEQAAARRRAILNLFAAEETATRLRKEASKPRLPRPGMEVRTIVDSITTARTRKEMERIQRGQQRRHELEEERAQILRQQHEMEVRIAEINRDLAAIQAYYDVKKSYGRRNRP